MLPLSTYISSCRACPDLLKSVLTLGLEVSQPVTCQPGSRRSALDAIILERFSGSMLHTRPPSPVERCNLPHDEASEVDAALQLKFVLGIPASFSPPGINLFFPLFHTIKKVNTAAPLNIGLRVFFFFWNTDWNLGVNSVFVARMAAGGSQSIHSWFPKRPLIH